MNVQKNYQFTLGYFVYTVKSELPDGKWECICDCFPNDSLVLPIEEIISAEPWIRLTSCS